MHALIDKHQRGGHYNVVGMHYLHYIRDGLRFLPASSWNSRAQLLVPFGKCLARGLSFYCYSTPFLGREVADARLRMESAIEAGYPSAMILGVRVTSALDPRDVCVACTERDTLKRRHPSTPEKQPSSASKYSCITKAVGVQSTGPVPDLTYWM